MRIPITHDEHILPPPNCRDGDSDVPQQCRGSLRRKGRRGALGARVRDPRPPRARLAVNVDAKVLTVTRKA